MHRVLSKALPHHKLSIALLHHRTIFCLVFLTVFSPTISAQNISKTGALPAINLLLNDQGTIKVDGTLSLPNGETAGAGGVTFEINAFLFVAAGAPKEVVTIPEGDDSVDYQISVPVSVNATSFRIRFNCILGCEGLDITTNGFWNEVDGVTGLFGATTYDVSETKLTVDIQLEEADTFAGTINLPDSLVFADDRIISVSVSNSQAFSLLSFGRSITIAAGESSVDFSIGVPKGLAPTSWALRFTFISTAGAPNIVSVYPTLVTGDPASLVRGERFLYPVNADYSDIVLTILNSAIN